MCCYGLSFWICFVFFIHAGILFLATLLLRVCGHLWTRPTLASVLGSWHSLDSAWCGDALTWVVVRDYTGNPLVDPSVFTGSGYV